MKKLILVMLVMAANVQGLDLLAPMKEYEITSVPGLRKNPWGGTRENYHDGYDLVGPPNSIVYAAARGKVIEVYQPYPGHPVYGGMVRLLHKDGSTTLYGHLKEVWVWIDWTCWQGRELGIQGSTGISTNDHLHFQHDTDPVFRPWPEQLDPLTRLINKFNLEYKMRRYEEWNVVP